MRDNLNSNVAPPCSKGGGRGAYQEVDGDLPTCCFTSRLRGTGALQFSVVSWNACGLSAGAINEVINMMGTARWDVSLLQEGPFVDESGCFEVVGGHLLFISIGESWKRSAGILAHRRLCHSKLSFILSAVVWHTLIWMHLMFPCGLHVPTCPTKDMIMMLSMQL
jgi:hypothetical protein